MDKQPAITKADQKKISEDTFLRAYREKQAAMDRFMDDITDRLDPDITDRLDPDITDRLDPGFM